MKERRHHNNKGLRQIKRGKTEKQVEDMARRILGGNNAERHNLRKL